MPAIAELQLLMVAAGGGDGSQHVGAALEGPDLLTDDIRQFFSSLR